MVPENGKIQVADETTVGRVRKNIIDAARLERFIQRRRVVGQHPEILPAIEGQAAIGLALAVIAQPQNFFLGGQNIEEAAVKSIPKRQLDTLGGELVAVDAEDARPTPASESAAEIPDKRKLLFSHSCHR